MPLQWILALVMDALNYGNGIGLCFLIEPAPPMGHSMGCTVVPPPAAQRHKAFPIGRQSCGVTPIATTFPTPSPAPPFPSQHQPHPFPKASPPSPPSPDFELPPGVSHSFVSCIPVAAAAVPGRLLPCDCADVLVAAAWGPTNRQSPHLYQAMSLDSSVVRELVADFSLQTKPQQTPPPVSFHPLPTSAPLPVGVLLIGTEKEGSFMHVDSEYANGLSSHHDARN
jgi:hypothetical protein